MDKYFHIRPRDKPEVNGNVIRQGEKSLEVFAGEAKLSDFDLRIKKDGRLEVGGCHYIEQIFEVDALRLKESFEYWKLMQAYVANDSSPESILSNTPGTRENALMRSRH